MSKWERAEASPDTDNLILLARIYQISLDELLSTTEPVEPVQREMESGPATNAEDAGGSEERAGEKDVTWVLFVTIPLYYWLAGGIRRWLRRRKRIERETDIEVN